MPSVSSNISYMKNDLFLNSYPLSLILQYTIYNCKCFKLVFFRVGESKNSKSFQIRSEGGSSNFQFSPKSKESKLGKLWFFPLFGTFLVLMASLICYPSPLSLIHSTFSLIRLNRANRELLNLFVDLFRNLSWSCLCN